MVPRPAPRHRRGAGRAGRGRLRRRWTRRGLAPGQAPRLLRRPARLAVVGARGRRCGPRGSLPACGPTFKTVDTCAAEFEAATPYHYSTYEDEDEVTRSGRREGAHPRFGPEPHRAGHRVRLLLRARQLRPGRRRLRDGDAQLQPRDGVHRLRHLRPPLLRAAHARGRPQRDRGRAGGPATLVGRHRRPRRADAAEAGRLAARGPRARHVARVDRPGRGPRALERAVRPPRDPAAGGRHRHHARAGPGHRRQDRLPGARCARRTCSAGGPWRSSTTTSPWRGPWTSWPGSAASAAKAACRPSAPCSSTGSSRTPPRSTSTPSATAPAR